MSRDINTSAVVVLAVVSVVVVEYTTADVILSVRAGALSDLSHSVFAGALSALVAIIATTGRGGPPGSPQPVTVVNPPTQPVPTDPQP